MDWFCAIRSAKIRLMRELIPELTVEEVRLHAYKMLCTVTVPLTRYFLKSDLIKLLKTLCDDIKLLLGIDCSLDDYA